MPTRRAVEALLLCRCWKTRAGRVDERCRHQGLPDCARPRFRFLSQPQRNLVQPHRVLSVLFRRVGASHGTMGLLCRALPEPFRFRIRSRRGTASPVSPGSVPDAALRHRPVNCTASPAFAGLSRSLSLAGPAAGWVCMPAGQCKQTAPCPDIFRPRRPVIPAMSLRQELADHGSSAGSACSRQMLGKTRPGGEASRTHGH